MPSYSSNYGCLQHGLCRISFFGCVQTLISWRELHAVETQIFKLLHLLIRTSSTSRCRGSSKLNGAKGRSIYSINTRNKHSFHRPNTNLSCFQKSTFCVGIRILNNLWHSLTVLKYEKGKFKVALRKYLNIYFFYSVGTFLCITRIHNVAEHFWYNCFLGLLASVMGGS